MPRGFFVTFEGLDGSGKSTQLRLLARALAAEGHAIITTRQPGGTELGDQIRPLLLDSHANPIAAPAEMALMFADRAQSIEQVIAPALDRGEIVLCDRYTDSTEAYQGGGRGLAREEILTLHRILCRDLWPDLTFLLLPELDACLSRARRRNARQQAVGVDENRFEAEQRSFYERVDRAYREIARRAADRVVVVGGDAPVEDIHRTIFRAFCERHKTAVTHELPPQRP
jgi:dTMP kinase